MITKTKEDKSLDWDKSKLPRKVIDLRGGNRLDDQALETIGLRQYFTHDFIATLKLFLDSEDYDIIAQTVGVSQTTVCNLLRRQSPLTRYNQKAANCMVALAAKRMRQHQRVINHFLKPDKDQQSRFISRPDDGLLLIKKLLDDVREAINENSY